MHFLLSYITHFRYYNDYRIYKYELYVIKFRKISKILQKYSRKIQKKEVFKYYLYYYVSNFIGRLFLKNSSSVEALFIFTNISFLSGIKVGNKK